MDTAALVNSMITTKSSLNKFAPRDEAKAKAYAEAQAALNSEAQKNWKNEAWHNEIAALISARVDWGFEFNNNFGQYFDVVNVGEFDVYEVMEVRGLEAFWVAKGGYIDETQLRTNRWTMGRDTIGFHVSEFEDKLRANFAWSLEQIVGLAEQRMDAQINQKMFQMLQAAVPPSSDYYVAATGGLTKAMLDENLTAVADTIRPNGAGRMPITIMGRRSAIDKISDVVTDPAALQDPSATEEIRRNGRLGAYRGANIQVLENYADANDVEYLPSDELWIFGGEVGKFVFYGGSVTKTWDEHTSDYRHYRTRKDCGGLVYHPEYARRIVITDES